MGAREDLIALLRDETGWEWPGEEDEPAPTFGCDTRVPSSETELGRLADRIIELLAPPAPPEPLGYVLIATYEGQPTPGLYETEGEAIAYAIELDRRRRDAGYLGPTYQAAAVSLIPEQTT